MHLTHFAMIVLLILVLVYPEAIATDATSQEPAEPAVLLAHRSEIRNLGYAVREEGKVTFRIWRTRHDHLMQDADNTEIELDKFIDAQRGSSDACSSRLLESKRALDGLISDLKSLTSQVESHEEVLKTENENLKVTKLSIDAAKDVYRDKIKICKQERAQAIADLNQYMAELEELEQIAKPSVRYNFTSEIPDIMPQQSPALLLMEEAWTQESCLAFLGFAHRHVKKWSEIQNSLLEIDTEATVTAGGDLSALVQQPLIESAAEIEKHLGEGSLGEVLRNVSTLSCNQQRKKLQRIFTKAYLALKDLEKDARDRSEDSSCFDTAKAEKAAKLVPPVAQRDQAAARIEYSAEALSALSPVLELVKQRTDALQIHIKDVLTPECTEADVVSKYLQRVRDLIISLEECPGRNDFKLEIPSQQAPTEDDDFFTDTGIYGDCLLQTSGKRPHFRQVGPPICMKGHSCLSRCRTACETQAKENVKSVWYVKGLKCFGFSIIKSGTKEYCRLFQEGPLAMGTSGVHSNPDRHCWAVSKFLEKSSD